MKKIVLRPASVSPSGKSYRIDYASVLNAQQYEAVMHSNGPALVLAGAGTGKTRTLTYRVARLVEDGVDPASILLLTFTRKAAAEMLRRASQLLDGRCEKVSGGTFHAFAFRVLKTYGLSSSEQRVASSEQQVVYSIIDQSDAEDIMNMVRSKFDLAARRKRFPNKGTLHDMYSKSINMSTPLEDLIAEQYPQFIDDTDTIRQMAHAYTDYKHKNSLFDYDDLLLYLLAMTRHDTTGPALRSQFRHVMVDEYQDTNNLQHQIVLGLSGAHGNVMVVGDDAQSIYSFRGANVRNIHTVPSSFASCAIIRLEENYRSTQPILDLCNAVLEEAPFMFEKKLRAHRGGGDLPMLITARSERQQSQFIAQHVLELREQGISLADIAVLVRSGFLSFDLEIELQRSNIPFRKFGGLKFAEAAHVKDVLARLRITENPRDVVSWFRVLQQLEGVGQKTAQTIIDNLQMHADPLAEPERTYGATGKGVQALQNLLHDLAKARRVRHPLERLQLIAEVYRATLERVHDDAPKRWKDIETIVGIGGRYGSCQEFLDDIALEPPTDGLDTIDPDDRETEFMTISTIHSAKGLEWKVVFVLSVNEGRLPSAKSADSEESLEEERRLLYVACTRAKDVLILTFPDIMAEWQHSDVLSRPSRFLDTVTNEICPRYFLAEEQSDSQELLP
ncbi:MAG: ATP-dependent helicase [Ignavibacteria bacterium]|nr:ATP-dependent helicase [Ignavibacteria bacterium]